MSAADGIPRIGGNKGAFDRNNAFPSKEQNNLEDLPA